MDRAAAAYPKLRAGGWSLSSSKPRRRAGRKSLALLLTWLPGVDWTRRNLNWRRGNRQQIRPDPGAPNGFATNDHLFRIAVSGFGTFRQFLLLSDIRQTLSNEERRRVARHAAQAKGRQNSRHSTPHATGYGEIKSDQLGLRHPPTSIGTAGRLRSEYAILFGETGKRHFFPEFMCLRERAGTRRSRPVEKRPGGATLGGKERGVLGFPL